MIIFGTRAKYKTVNTGEFHCPHCGKTRAYEHKQAKTYFALYFIPIFPIGEGGEFIECQTCHRTYALDVLSFKPSKPQADVARALTMIKTKLEGGYPIEYVVSDLTLQNYDRDIANNMVTMAVGDVRKTCPKCGLTYASTIDLCPDDLERLELIAPA